MNNNNLICKKVERKILAFHLRIADIFQNLIHLIMHLFTINNIYLLNHRQGA